MFVIYYKNKKNLAIIFYIDDFDNPLKREIKISRLD